MAGKSITMEKGQKFPLTIKRLGIDGEGVGFFKKQVVFVPGALPGEEAVCRVEKVGKRFVSASIVKLRRPSPDRVTAPCPVYDVCGGCQLQHLSYDGQLQGKRDLVLQAFERYTKLPVDRLDIRQTLGMEHPWRYRNKSQMQAGVKNGSVITGLYASGSNQLVDIDTCIVQHPETDRVTAEVRAAAEEAGVTVYNPKKGTGFLRTIVVRTGVETGETQLVLVTTEETFPKKEAFLAGIQRRLPGLTSVAQNINPSKTPIVFGEKTVPIAGKEKITEKLDELVFELSPRAFFQLNTEQTKVLYGAAADAASLSGKEKVVDAYCGTGTIGLSLASGAREVRGMDMNGEAVADAVENARSSGVAHASFVHGKAEDVLPQWREEGWRPDVIVVDPPRTGLDETFLKTVAHMAPERFVYISCNPSTLAKNTAFLIDNGFRLDYVQAVDMFPQTAQVEAVASFVRK